MIWLSFALVVVPILAHTCWVCTFLCLSRERTIYNTIMLIPTVFLPYALVSNCYLATLFFIRIIREKFEFTSHADSRSFAKITRTLSTWLHTCLIVILPLSRNNRAQMKNFWFLLSPTEIGANFKHFTFIHIRQYIRHSETWALDFTWWILRYSVIYLNILL